MAKQLEDKTDEKTVSKICGIIMPISPTDGYPDSHWQEVMSIIKAVVKEAGFEPNIVSDADDVGIIHNRIVNNLAENPIVICDVSSKNPNVMFELGLRLAFDKATIIIKDELTGYNFDTSPIEHLAYPADLHYHKIQEFKVNLKLKLQNTYEASKKEEYSTFLKHFVNYKPALKTEEVSALVFFEKQFEKIFKRLDSIDRRENNTTPNKRIELVTTDAAIEAEKIMEAYCLQMIDDKNFMAMNKEQRVKTLFLKTIQRNNHLAAILGEPEILKLAQKVNDWYEFV
jgi:hypothetical protein